MCPPQHVQPCYDLEHRKEITPGSLKQAPGVLFSLFSEISRNIREKDFLLPERESLARKVINSSL